MPGSPARGVRKGRAQAVAEAHAAGDRLDARAHDGEVARRQAHHPVDRPGIPGGAFALDPRAQAAQHVFGIERKGVQVHCGSSPGG
jgi:hypothetical protein